MTVLVRVVYRLVNGHASAMALGLAGEKGRVTLARITHRPTVNHVLVTLFTPSESRT
jgi:hypothetical protein